MREADLLELRQRMKLQTLRLIEIMDLTAQLQKAADRRDEISVNLLLSMRAEPLERLAEMNAALRRFVAGLPEEDAARMRELLEGGAPRTDTERAAGEEIEKFRRTLAQAREQDRRLSLSVGGDKSYYAAKR